MYCDKIFLAINARKGFRKTYVFVTFRGAHKFHG